MTLSADDWAAIRAWASPAIAFFAFIVALLAHRRAIKEARLKAAESEARAAETKKYADTLDSRAQPSLPNISKAWTNELVRSVVISKP